jgi:hypothetical protein
LYENNVLHLKDVPDEFPLNDKQWMQVNSEIRNETSTDKDAIEKFVGDLTYPIYHLDFETFTSAVPIFNGSRPYQQLVFQYSLHIEHEDSRLEQKECLAETNGENPRILYSGDARFLFNQKVLPALAPSLSYKNLNIQKGGTASTTFAQMLQGNFEGDIEQVRKDLLAYCELDTLAMVKIFGVLKTVLK